MAVYPATMFEGKPPVPAPDAMHQMEQDGARAMRELSWSDLVARLVAARDLRTIIAAEFDANHASFDAGSARWIADHGGTADRNGDFAVNPEASANGKWESGNSVPPQKRTATGVPRN